MLLQGSIHPSVTPIHRRACSMCCALQIPRSMALSCHSSSFRLGYPPTRAGQSQPFSSPLPCICGYFPNNSPNVRFVYLRCSHAAARLHRPTYATLSIPVMQGRSIVRFVGSALPRFAWPIVFVRAPHHSTSTLLLPINSECLGYACEIYGDPSLVSAAGRLLPVLIDPFVIQSLYLHGRNRQPQLHFHHSNIFSTKFPCSRRRSSQADDFGPNTLRVMYHLLALMIRPQASIRW